KLFEGRLPADGVALAERVSGDTTVGHALAFCQALESAVGMAEPDRARHLRVVLLELERLYNHVADFGMIANDTGFAVAHSHGFLGYVARASGLDADARRDHPFAAYGALRFRVPVFESGDVKARALVRVEEARESVALIRQAVEGLPPGPLAASLPPLPAWEP